MAAAFSFDEATRKGTIEIIHGGTYVTTKVINGNTVFFDSTGAMVRVEVPNALGTINLTGLPFKSGDHEDAVRVLGFHGRKTSG